ncbi:hypothetical protein Tco_1463181, partial [Tanacetum coccineum]
DILIRASRLKKVKANMGKMSSMETFAPNDKADYYSGITSITVNRKNAYELKGKFLDDLHNNAFSGTNGKDAVKHIEYYLKIIDLIKLPNVDHDKLRIVVFPISLVGGARRWFYRTKESITCWVDLTAKNFGKYYPSSRIEGNNTPKEPKPVKHTCKPFNYKTGCSEWPTYSWREDGYCNGGNLPGAYHIGNSLHYQDLEWYEALEDSELKDEALRNKAIMEGLISDDESSNDCWKRWKNETHDEGHELCGIKTHEVPVCQIKRYKMIKYSFNNDEEYVVVKEDEYDDLTITSKEACRAYQEIFQMMDEGWM